MLARSISATAREVAGTRGLAWSVEVHEVSEQFGVVLVGSLYLGQENAELVADAINAAVAVRIPVGERERLLLAVRHTCACWSCKDAIADLIGDIP